MAIRWIWIILTISLLTNIIAALSSSNRYRKTKIET